jgi:hypothetical protein
METQVGLCVSLYMPTHRKGTETQQNQIRFKNLLRKTEDRLIESDLRPQEAKEFLRPAQELLGDAPFWQNQFEGLALFISPLSFDFFRLPIEFKELVTVTDRFHIKPLLPAVSGDIEFYILAISRKNVRLIECTRFSAEEVDLENVPADIADAFKTESLEKEPQFHTRRHPAGFKGLGGGTEDPKDNVDRYFKQVDKGLNKLMKGKQAPLVFSGVDYLFPIYREANTYPHLLDKQIPGNQDESSIDDLHNQAWPLVEYIFEKEKAEAIEQYQQSSGTGLASIDLKEIISAAYHGRIALLFVALGTQQWGTFEPATDDVVLQETAQLGNADLLDFAAIQALSNGGTVYAVTPGEVPDGAVIAAVFRY